MQQTIYCSVKRFNSVSEFTLVVQYYYNYKYYFIQTLLVEHLKQCGSDAVEWEQRDGSTKSTIKNY